MRIQFSRCIRRLSLGLLSAAMLAGSGAAGAQPAWPAKPITVISPFATGGSVDVLTRLVGEHMGRSLGQPIVVSTLAGAGGISRALSAALDDSDVQQRMARLGTNVPPAHQRGPRYADEFVRSEIRKWEDVARGARLVKQ